MKKILLIAFIFVFVASAYSQPYKGTPWTGTAWTFGMDTAANFNVGNNYTHKKGIYNGIPHYLYDIGEVDTLMRAGDDPEGNLVAGSGIINDNDGAYTYRVDQAGTDAKTLTESDLGAINSPNFAGIFTSHQNRAVTDRSGGWYRYTLNFTEQGNYNLVLRCWGNDNVDQAFWIRMYEKATMAPIIPWTRYHPGSGDGNANLQEGLSYLEVMFPPYDGYTITTLPAKTDWMVISDQFTVGGEVVLEYCDSGPTEAYGESAAAGGSLGEIVFEYVGAAEDKFAPVAEVWKEVYDELDTISLTLSEDGTLYIVPDGTAVEDLETANIDKMEMTSGSVYAKAATEFLGDTIQIVTKDAAENTRLTPAITFRNVIIPDTLAGSNGDSIGMSLSRSGVVALVPNDVNPDPASVLMALAMGNADTAMVEAGRDTLVISNLTGDKDCGLYYVDLTTFAVTQAIDFLLVAGEPGVGIQQKVASVFLYMERSQIIINHNGDFEDLYVFDMLGKQQLYQRVSSNRLEVDASGLASGIYILKMYGRNDGMINRKFMINNR